MSWPLGRDQGFPRGVSILGTHSLPCPPCPLSSIQAASTCLALSHCSDHRLSLLMSCSCSAPPASTCEQGQEEARPLNMTHQPQAPLAASGVGFRWLTIEGITGQGGDPLWSDLGYVSSQKVSFRLRDFGNPEGIHHFSFLQPSPIFLGQGMNAGPD